MSLSQNDICQYHNIITILILINMPPSIPIAAILLLMSISFTNSKIFETKFTINDLRRRQGWNYIGKMHLSPGPIQEQLTISIYLPQFKNKQYHLEVTSIPSSLWPLQFQNKCNLTSYPPQLLTQKSQKQFHLPITLSPSSHYQSAQSSTYILHQQQTFYFVLKDCSNSLLEQGFGKKSQIHVELNVKNNQKHISKLQQYYHWILPLIIVGHLIILFGLNWDHEEQGSNWIKILLKISLWLAVASLSVKYAGHLIYAFHEGRLYDIFDTFYLLLHSASDYLVLFLLLFLAFGWTVTFNDHSLMTLFVPIASILGFVHIIVVVMNKVSDGQHDKDHMFDSIPAYFMVAFRIVKLGIFLYGCIRSMVLLKPDEVKIRNYFKQILILGILYLAFIPIGFMVIDFVSAEKQQETLLLSLQIIKLLLSAWLGYLAGYKMSAYRLVLNTSFMEKNEKYF